MPDQKIEELAALEHEQWAHWTKYMLDNLNEENIGRWAGQINTPYSELPEDEKESDREWAEKAANICKKNAVRYKHDCEECKPLGQFAEHDLYYCEKLLPTIIARYSDDEAGYNSGLGVNYAPLQIGQHMAVELGYLEDFL